MHNKATGSTPCLTSKIVFKKRFIFVLQFLHNVIQILALAFLARHPLLPQYPSPLLSTSSTSKFNATSAAVIQLDALSVCSHNCTSASLLYYIYCRWIAQLFNELMFTIVCIRRKIKLIVLYCIVLYCIVLYRIVLYCIVYTRPPFLPTVGDTSLDLGSYRSYQSVDGWMRFHRSDAHSTLQHGRRLHESSAQHRGRPHW